MPAGFAHDDLRYWQKTRPDENGISSKTPVKRRNDFETKAITAAQIPVKRRKDGKTKTQLLFNFSSTNNLVLPTPHLVVEALNANTT